MLSFSSVDRAALRWIRREETRHDYRLLSGDSEIASLTWHRSGGSLSTIDTIDHRWTLKRGGFLNPHVSIRDAATGADVGRLSAHVNYSLLEIPGKGSFRLHRAGLLVPAWEFTSESGKRLLHIEPVREGRKLVGGIVDVEEAGRALEVLPLLVAVSWYYIVLAWFEDEAVAASQAVLSAAS